MIVVTGGAGFVGSNLVHAMSASGRDVVVVDDMTDVAKVANVSSARVSDYLDREELVRMVAGGSTWLRHVRAVLHQGARTSTTDTDGRAVMAENHGTSRLLLQWCRRSEVPFIYASSAAVYGASATWVEDERHEAALNVYGWSKQVFDAHVRRELAASPGGSQVVGLRYFNVYGPREDHKGAMASVVAQLDIQARSGGPMRLFGPGCGKAAGEHRRDFVHVDDVVASVQWFLDRPDLSGIFNCGTGVSRTFNDVARLVGDHHGGVEVEYLPFPAELSRRYQAETRADLSRLRAVGYTAPFISLEDGVGSYLRWRDEAAR